MRCNLTPTRPVFSQPRFVRASKTIHTLQKPISTTIRVMAQQKGSAGSQLSPALEAEFTRLAQKLPSNITNIVPSTLQAFTEEQGTRPLIIVDVRTPEERLVSRLPGPVISKDDFEADKTKYKNHRVVCYCTAGYRSGQYTSQLVKEGFDEVYNLKGSVLAWAEAGLPFVDGQDGTTPTNKVHTYGATWAPLLDKKYEPVTFSLLQTIIKAITG